MTVRPSRRWVLRGLGGVSLAIPALPSLLKREARANEADNKIFIGIVSHFGGSWASKMFPSMPSDAESRSYAGHTIRRAPLHPEVSGGKTKVSDVLTASSDVLTPSLVKKLTLLQGLDIPFWVNHHTSATLGNYASGDDPSPVGQNFRRHPRPTIDQVIASSPAFYRNLQGITQRSVSYGTFGNLSQRWNVAGDRSSGVVGIPALDQPSKLMAGLFGNRMLPSPANGPRSSIVDLVREDYARLRQSGKLSGLDLERLDEHMERVVELQRRQAITIKCEQPTPRKNHDDPCAAGIETTVRNYVAHQDVLVAGLACGLTRVATSLHQGWNSTFGELCQDPWHQRISHEVGKPGPQESMNASMRTQFAEVIVPLAAKLDSVKDGVGGTLLDKTVILWTHEHGTYSHGQENIPVILFGSGGGAIKTGHHIDYRDMGHSLKPGEFGAEFAQAGTRIGLTWHQFLGSMLQIFGIPKEEWREENHGGYGYRPPVIQERQRHWEGEIFSVAGEMLPYLT